MNWFQKIFCLCLVLLVCACATKQSEQARRTPSCRMTVLHLLCPLPLIPRVFPEHPGVDTELPEEVV